MHLNFKDHNNRTRILSLKTELDTKLQRIPSNFYYFRFYLVIFFFFFSLWIYEIFIAEFRLALLSANVYKWTTGVIDVVVIVFTKDEFQTQLYNSQGYTLITHTKNPLFHSQHWNWIYPFMTRATVRLSLSLLLLLSIPPGKRGKETM